MGIFASALTGRSKRALLLSLNRSPEAPLSPGGILRCCEIAIALKEAGLVLKVGMATGILCPFAGLGSEEAPGACGVCEDVLRAGLGSAVGHTRPTCYSALPGAQSGGTSRTIKVRVAAQKVSHFQRSRIRSMWRSRSGSSIAGCQRRRAMRMGRLCSPRISQPTTLCWD
jgi:hypothetical protein